MFILVQCHSGVAVTTVSDVLGEIPIVSSCLLIVKACVITALAAYPYALPWLTQPSTLCGMVGTMIVSFQAK